MTPMTKAILSGIECTCADGYVRTLDTMTCDKCLMGMRLVHAKNPDAPFCKCGARPDSFESPCVATFERRGVLTHGFVSRM